MAKTLDSGIETRVKAASKQVSYLYEIELDSNLTLRYTDNASDIVFPTGGDTYNARGVTHSQINTDMSRVGFSKVSIIFDNADKYLLTYFVNNRYEFRGKTVRIRRIYRDYVNNSNYYVPVFEGHITEVETDWRKFKIVAKHILSSLDEESPNDIYSPFCRHNFGDTYCNASGKTSASTYYYGKVVEVLDPALNNHFRVADIGGLGGLITSLNSNKCRNGTVEFTSGSNTGVRLTIAEHTKQGDRAEIKTFASFEHPIVVGDECKFLQGCDKTKDTCLNVHNNLENFGGFLGIVDKWRAKPVIL